MELSDKTEEEAREIIRKIMNLPKKEKEEFYREVYSNGEDRYWFIGKKIKYSTATTIEIAVETYKELYLKK